MHGTRKKQLRIWLISIANAFFMLGFTYYWLSLPYTFGDEAFLIKWSSLIKKSLFGFDPKPSPEDVLFVDVSNNKTTINGINDFGEQSPYRRKVITDRQHLAEFFALMNRYKADVKFVLCDVLFEDTTRYDSLLEKEFEKMGDKLLGVSHLTTEGKYIRPVVDLNFAPATYSATEGLFLKFPLLLEDTLNTAPLVMFQKLHHARFNKGKWMYWTNKRLSLPAPIVDFKVRNTDFRLGTELGEANFTFWDMGFILDSREFMGDEALSEYFKDKIILIGDFKDDMHMTPFGKMPGLLIIYNAYLTLVSKQNVISSGWIFFLLIAFTFISYRIFSDIRISRPTWLFKMFQSKIGQLVLNALDEVVLLTIVTLLSYFLFNIHINILILLIYLKTMELVWKKAGLHKKQTAVLEEAATT